MESRFQAIRAYLKTEVFPRIQKIISQGDNPSAAEMPTENDHNMQDSTPEEDEEVQEITPIRIPEPADRKQRLSSQLSSSVSSESDESDG